MEELHQGKLRRGTLLWRPSVGLEAARQGWASPASCSITFQSCLGNCATLRPKAVMSKENPDEMFFRAGAALQTLGDNLVQCVGGAVVQSLGEVLSPSPERVEAVCMSEAS